MRSSSSISTRHASFLKDEGGRGLLSFADGFFFYLIMYSPSLLEMNARQTDVFIFDCDGVIWKGDSLIEGIPNVLQRLREAGKR